MNGHQQAALGYGEPSFKIVIDLAETLGQFDLELGDPYFESVQETLNNQAASYIARGLIHNVLKIPGGLSIREAASFFPPFLQPRAEGLLTSFWDSLSTEIARSEQMVKSQSPVGSQYEICHIPAPMINGHSSLTLWYRWLTPAEIGWQQASEIAAGLRDKDVSEYPLGS